MFRSGIALGTLLLATAWLAPAHAADTPIEVTVADMVKEFKANATAARDKYRGKIVQISGISGGQAGTDCFYLKESTKGEIVVGAFYYDSPKDEQTRLKAVKSNSKVVIVGQFSSYVDRIELTKTKLVKVEK